MSNSSSRWQRYVYFHRQEAYFERIHEATVIPNAQTVTNSKSTKDVLRNENNIKEHPSKQTKTQLHYCEYISSACNANMGSVYDEIEIEDMTWDTEKLTFFYPCPCGDKFFITMVRGSVPLSLNTNHQRYIYICVAQERPFAYSAFFFFRANNRARSHRPSPSP